MPQLKLPFPVTHDESHVTAYLRKKTGRQVALVLTDNATSMISFRRKGEVVTLRLHRLFLAADEPILDEIAGFIKKIKIENIFPILLVKIIAIVSMSVLNLEPMQLG